VRWNAEGLERERGLWEGMGTDGMHGRCEVVGSLGAVPELYVVSGRAVVFSEEVFYPEQQIAGYDCTSVRD
jgi:hypothetical protein